MLCFIKLGPRSFSINVIVNDPFFIAGDSLFQKRVYCIRFEMCIYDPKRTVVNKIKRIFLYQVAGIEYQISKEERV